MINLSIDSTTEVNEELVKNYFRQLVNSIFKILPMKENGEESLTVYIKSLQSEVVGFNNLVEGIRDNAEFLQLLSILQYQVDNPTCSVDETRREVFKAIAIANKLKGLYSKGVA